MIQGNLDVSKRDANESSQMPALKWITAEQLAAGGLSSSVTKVFKLVSTSKAAERASIKKFFKAK